MGPYLEATGRPVVPESVAHHFRADDGVKYDEVVEIDLSKLEPMVISIGIV